MRRFALRSEGSAASQSTDVASRSIQCTRVWRDVGCSTTYYVSGSTGSDANDGLSSLTAFETVATVNALSLVPGDDQTIFTDGFESGDMSSWGTAAP